MPEKKKRKAPTRLIDTELTMLGCAIVKVEDAINEVLQRAKRTTDELAVLHASCAPPPIDDLTQFWMDHYLGDTVCTLCGNTGVLDTRSAVSPTGEPVGRLNYCLCPNGQLMREHQVPLTKGNL